MARSSAGRGAVQDYMKDYKIIALMGFLRAFGGGIVGIGIAIFILNYWGSYYWSGVSSAAVALTYIFATIVCGRISDKIGRRSSLLIATGSNFAIAVGIVAVVVLVRFTTEPWLLALIILLRLAEGVANGFFWPTLQASLSDVAMNSCGEGEQERVELIARRGQGIYNLGWSIGMLVGQVVLSTLSLAGLLDAALLITIASHGANFLIAILLFRVVMNRSGCVAVAEVPCGNGHAEDGHVIRGRPDLHENSDVRIGLVVALLGLVMIFVYALALGSLSTTTTNLFKGWGVATLVGYIEAIRLAAQSFTASKVRFGKKNVTFKLIGTGGLLAVMFLAMASLSVLFAPPLPGPQVTATVVAIFMGIYATNGLLFGVTYAEAMNMVITSGATKRRGLLMGLFESAIGIGFFLGPYLAGVITEFTTFHDSYFVTAVLLFLLLSACIAMAVYLRHASSATVEGRIA